jgi:hypothetical protein
MINALDAPAEAAWQELQTAQDAAAAVPARIRLGEIAPDMVRLEAWSKRLPTQLTSRVSAGQAIKQDHVRVLE